VNRLPPLRLAKAQMTLTNPEKSLTATVATNRPGEPGRPVRYAPLSSGLDIVRKALGQHEIATVQTTAIDPATQAVSLTMVLAHSSGEWIASDWPVCALSEMATPRRTWTSVDIDPVAVAQRLWHQTRIHGAVAHGNVVMSSSSPAIEFPKDVGNGSAGPAEQ
jgi:hypothetical protein